MLRTTAVALSTAALAVTGTVAANATPAPTAGFAAPATTTLSTSCYTEFEAVTPTKQLAKSIIQGPRNVRAVINAPLTFVPRLMAHKGYYKSTYAGRGVMNEELFAVRGSDGSLWRITWTYTYDKKINKVAYRKASPKRWSSTRAMTISGNRLYYIDGAGTLRRSGIDSAGNVWSTSTVMRTGLSGTKFIVSGGTGYTTVNGVRTATWDVVLAVTKGGALYQHRYVFSGKGTSGALLLAARGWDRFTGLAIGSCGGRTSVYTGRDARTKRLYSYYDSNVLTVGDRLAYKGSPGSLTWYLYS